MFGFGNLPDVGHLLQNDGFFAGLGNADTFDLSWIKRDEFYGNRSIGFLVIHRMFAGVPNQPAENTEDHHRCYQATGFHIRLSPLPPGRNARHNYDERNHNDTGEEEHPHGVAGHAHPAVFGIFRPDGNQIFV